MTSFPVISKLLECILVLHMYLCHLYQAKGASQSIRESEENLKTPRSSNCEVINVCCVCE